MLKKSMLAFVPLLLLAPSSPSLAQTPEPPKADVGVLVCSIGEESETDGKSLTIDCNFERKDEPGETYDGKIGKAGVQIPPGAKTVMAWQVLSATPNVDVGALAGTYEGAVNPLGEDRKEPRKYLIGGRDGTITLIPLSVAAESNINIAAVFAQLQLKSVKS